MTNPKSPNSPTPVLYVKSFCVWCVMAERKLKQLGVRYKEVNVSKDPNAFDEMERVSGQTYAPTMVVGEKVLADFGPEELEPFLKEVGLL
ncbi:MAG: glutaredoxin family protein [Verrucomicrobiae bacterium]|nr:glutaredoxin family protein [Verrucomicrobiae bacterium]